MKLTYMVCKLEIKNKPIKVKSETLPLLQIHMHHQMCDIALIQNQYAPQMWGRAPTPTPYAPPART